MIKSKDAPTAAVRRSQRCALRLYSRTPRGRTVHKPRSHLVIHQEFGRPNPAAVLSRVASARRRVRHSLHALIATRSSRGRRRQSMHFIKDRTIIDLEFVHDENVDLRECMAQP